MFAHVLSTLLASGMPALSRSDEAAITLVAFAVIASPFVIWMIADCARYESLDNASVKHVWLFVILFAPGGSVIYYFARKRRRHRLPL